MTSIILAAGQGTRLRPYTDELPKCMVPLAGKPLLHHQMDTLAACGADSDMVVVGGYRSDRLDLRNAELITNPAYDSTNMVTTLFCARDRMRDGEDLLISYGDIVFEPGVLRALLDGDGGIRLAADRQWERLWSTRMDNPLDDAETFVMDASGTVIELGKKPGGYDEVQAQYMGLIFVRGDQVADFKHAYDELDRSATYDGKDFDNMYMTSFLQYLIDSGRGVHACLVDSGWLEVDTTDELEQFESMAGDGTLDEFCRLS